MCTQKMRALSYIGAEKITFPPKPYIHTDRRTDISVYRVASLPKICCNEFSRCIFNCLFFNSEATLKVVLVCKSVIALVTDV